MKLIRLLFTLVVFITTGNLAKAQCPSIVMSGTHLDCYGDANGSAAVVVTGGVGPYTYSWSTGATVTSIGGLTAGTYTVHVRDAGTGCTVLGAFTVNSPGPLALSGTASDVSCFAGSDGQVMVSVTGGTLPYGYSWSNGSTSQNLTNASAGTHTLTVTDANGCQIVRSYIINEPAQGLGSSISATDVSCFGGTNANIDLSVFGGTSPYTYLWSNGAATQDLSNVSAGTYTVLVTDSKGCTTPNSIVISQPDQLAVDVTVTNVSCFGYSDGALTANITGGMVPYNYVWQSTSFTYGVNNAILSNIPSDDYTVTVTDANGCQVSGNAVVGSPSPLVSSIMGIDVSCHGGTNGSIDLSVSGSVPAYNYSWSNEIGPMPESTQDLNNIPAGEYTVVITDQNLCSATESIIISEPEFPISLSADITNVDCYNTNTGEIQLSVTGGTTPYIVSWSNGQVGLLNTNLFAGSYTASVTDANGCFESGIYAVIQPSDTLFSTHIMNPVVCFGETNGSIDMIPTGGTSPYSYEWKNSSFQLSAITQDLVDFSADTYYFEMTDAKGCVFKDTIEITQPPLLTGIITPTHVLCKGNNTGEIDLFIEGGVPGYTYNWSNGQTTQDLTDLFAGDYSVEVTDANNCVFNASTTVTEPSDPLGYTVSIVDVTCHGGNDGRIDVIPTGGTAPYFIDWSSADNTFIIDELTAGIYSFELTDINGCQIEASVEVNQPEPLLANEVVTDVTCFGFDDGIIDISPSGGSAPYSFRWYNSTFTLSVEEEDLVNFPAETYQLVITDSLECVYQIFIELPEPEPLTSNFDQVNVTCAGGQDGSVDLEIFGGNPDYSYNWSNGSTSQDLINVPIGEYVVVVTDTKDCELSLSFTLLQPDPIEMTFVTTDVTCFDQLDGTAAAFPTGGVGAYTYEWSTGSTYDYVENLVEGWYTLTVSDIVGCTGTDSAYISIDLTTCIDPPSAFTPNGDDYNDSWVIRNLYLYTEMNIQVFNRWGNVVFSQDGGVYEPWDGTYNGEPLPSETYYYILILNDEYEPFKGTVTIVR